MAESDGDIEFLDEDADIVQQCLQAVPVPVQVPHLVPQVAEKPTPLLVERLPAEKKRKRRKDEDDSDYDPNDDIVAPSPKGKKKKQPAVKKSKTYRKEVVLSSGAGPSLKAIGPVQTRKPKFVPANEIVLDRKQLNIRIPDYDDPLCLPVKAIRYEESDIKRMNNWNSVCLERFKYCNNLLKPESGKTSSSARTVVFRNVANKQSGKTETTIWSKTCAENEDGDKKSEIFQCVLPRYKEKKVLTMFSLSSRKPKPFHVTDEVILSKEDSKDGEVLVAYKPREASSAVYKLVAPSDQKSSDPKDEAEDFEEDKMYMKELVYCKMCAPCFQMSWRGIKKNTTKSIACPICSRSFITIYNLLTHFKTHSSEDMHKYKKVISSILAEKVDYLYKCRVCAEQFISIKELRQHLSTHQGNEVFTCEVCNHMVK